MGPSQDSAALVRSVFVLTQLTFAPVKTAAELDLIMRSQGSWGGALEAALRGDYSTVQTFLSRGQLL